MPVLVLFGPLLELLVLPVGLLALLGLVLGPLPDLLLPVLVLLGPLLVLLGALLELLLLPVGLLGLLPVPLLDFWSRY